LGQAALTTLTLEGRSTGRSRKWPAGDVGSSTPPPGETNRPPCPILLGDRTRVPRPSGLEPDAHKREHDGLAVDAHGAAAADERPTCKAPTRSVPKQSARSHFRNKTLSTSG